MFVDNVPEDQRDDPFFEMVSSRLQGIREEHEILGGDMESRIGQEQLFGPEEDGQDNLVRGKLKDFLKEMQADAANGLKGAGSRVSWTPRRARGPVSWARSSLNACSTRTWTGHLAKRRTWLLRALPRGGPGGLRRSHGQWSRKVGGQFFQVKDSIIHAGRGRRMKAGG